MSTNPERAVSYVLNKQVTEYMDKDVLILNRDTSTGEAARMLRHYETDDIVVTDGGVPVGIVTDEDILSKVSDASVYAESTKLKDIMTAPLITIHRKATLQEALHIMRDNDIRKLPVLSKNNEVVGMIYQTTIANAIRDATSSEPRLLSPPVKAVLGNLGFVLQFAGVLLLVPAIVSTILEDTLTATGIYLTTVLLLVTGFFLNSYGEKSSLNLQQASILVFSSLFLLSLFGTVPYLYVFPSEESNAVVFGNAFFSSAAGFTTGGISLFDTPEEQLTQSFTFYRSYTQLVGGMSFIYLVITAFYPESKLQSMRGFISGRTLHMKELFSTITVIFAVYIVIVAVLLYFFGQENLLDDFSLAMSTLATGGFVPSSTIIDSLGWQEEIVLMGAMILGALPFTFHYAFVRKKFLAPKLGKEVLAYFAILGGATMLFVAISGLEPLESVFYSVSASTTAGLQLQSLAGLGGAAHAILMTLMFVGGCGFSTAGGLKIFRLFHLRDCRAFFGAKRREMSSQTKKEITSTLIILALFPAISALTGLHLAETEDVAYQDAFFEAAGVITTGGLSAGVIDADTDPATKIVLGFLMIFGRLEIIAIIYIFVPRLS